MWLWSKREWTIPEIFQRKKLQDCQSEKQILTSGHKELSVWPFYLSDPVWKVQPLLVSPIVTLTLTSQTLASNLADVKSLLKESPTTVAIFLLQAGMLHLVSCGLQILRKTWQVPLYTPSKTQPVSGSWVLTNGLGRPHPVSEPQSPEWRLGGAAGPQQDRDHHSCIAYKYICQYKNSSWEAMEMQVDPGRSLAGSKSARAWV